MDPRDMDTIHNAALVMDADRWIAELTAARAAQALRLANL